MGEEGGAAPGVEKDDRRRRVDPAASDIREEGRHRLAGIDGVEQNRLRASEQLNRGDPFRGWHTVALADKIACDAKVVAGDDGGKTNQVSGSVGQADAALDHRLDPMRDSDAVDGKGGGVGAGADDQSGLGAERAGGVIEPVRRFAQRHQLGGDLGNGGDVAHGTEGDAATGRDQIGPFTATAEVVGEPLDCGGPVVGSLDNLHLGPEEVVEQQIASASATRYSSLRALLPPNARPVRSSRLK